MKYPNIVILAGGISSRMKNRNSVSDNIDPQLQQEIQLKSKSMLSIGESSRPFLDYLLYNIMTSGYTDVVIVTGEQDFSIREYYETQKKSKQFNELHITYKTQLVPKGRNKPLGTADALLQALESNPEWRGKIFTVCNSDNLYSVNALKSLLDHPADNAMIDYDRAGLQFDRSRIEMFAVIKKDENGFVSDLFEKPSSSEVERARDPAGRIGVSMNIFKLSYDMIYPFLGSVPLHPIRQEKELPHAVKLMVGKYPKCLVGIPLSEHVIDLTNPSDIEEVKKYLKKHYPRF